MLNDKEDNKKGIPYESPFLDAHFNVSHCFT
jgi:hypothetical protein